VRSAVTPLIMVGLIAVVFFSTRSPRLLVSGQKELVADFKFEQVTVTLHRHGKKIWAIRAKESSLYKNANTMYMSGVSGTYTGKEQGTLSIDSPDGMVNIGRQTLKFVKTTVTLNSNYQQVVMICDEIEIDAKKNSLSAYGNLVLNSDQLMLKSQRLEADLTKNQLVFSNQIYGTIISNAFN
jgi:LPS export ABC transporter protein LptC